MQIQTQADGMVWFVITDCLTNWSNEEVMWNSQFYHVIHEQLYLGIIKLVEKVIPS